jgi:hypothetical protein
LELLCRYRPSGHTSGRGPGRYRAARNQQASADATCRSRHRPRPGQSCDV